MDSSGERHGEGRPHLREILRQCEWAHPRLLDVLDIAFLVPQPHRYQTENHRIDPCKRWTYRGTIKPQELLPGVQQVRGPLWFNGGSTKFGLNDMIPEEATASFTNSLLLVQPEELAITVTIEGEKNGEPRRRIRGEFAVSSRSMVAGTFSQ